MKLQNCDIGVPNCDIGAPKCDNGVPKCDNGVLKCDNGVLKLRCRSSRKRFGIGIGFTGYLYFPIFYSGQKSIIIQLGYGKNSDNS